jgi:glycerophosphoryl diester phosphodiesterase
MSPVSATEIVAHRGASFDAPENTLASINLAWKRDTDAVEIDIQLTADGKIVAMHDKTPKRTAGGKDAPISEHTLAELRTLDAGSWKGKEFAGERIPTLAEILETIPAGKRLFIEIKTEAEILPELKRVLDAAGRPARETPLICFSYETMRAAKELLPNLKMYWLVKLENDKRTGKPNYTAEQLIEKVRAARLDGVDLGAAPPLDEEFVQTLRKANLEIYVWTVNDVEQARAYKHLGLDGITTDKPDVMLERLRKVGTPK